MNFIKGKQGVYTLRSEPQKSKEGLQTKFFYNYWRSFLLKLETDLVFQVSLQEKQFQTLSQTLLLTFLIGEKVHFHICY